MSKATPRQTLRVSKDGSLNVPAKLVAPLSSAGDEVSVCVILKPAEHEEQCLVIKHAKHEGLFTTEIEMKLDVREAEIEKTGKSFDAWRATKQRAKRAAGGQ